MSILKRGLKGAPVRRLQEKLGIAADGDFGPGTERAVKAFQEANGLAVDGIAGPDTFSAMGLHELVLLRRGSRGAAVKRLQEGLGIGADGIFGKGTEAAVMAFQVKEGLAADGMAGPETLARLTSFEEITPEIVARTEVQPAELEWEVGPLPDLDGMDFKPAEANEEIVMPEERSLWGRVTGWFN